MMEGDELQLPSIMTYCALADALNRRLWSGVGVTTSLEFGMPITVKSGASHIKRHDCNNAPRSHTHHIGRLHGGRGNGPCMTAFRAAMLHRVKPPLDRLRGWCIAKASIGWTASCHSTETSPREALSLGPQRMEDRISSNCREMSGMASRIDAPGDGDALDRGRLGNSELVAFRRFGARVLLIERQTKYYTLASKLGSPDDAGLSFADAVIASFDVKGRGRECPADRCHGLLPRDGIHVTSILRGAGQGNYSIDEKRARWTPRGRMPPTPASRSTRCSRSRPENCPRADTHQQDCRGPDRAVAPRTQCTDPTAGSQHSSYRPRIFDPRSGFIDKTHQDPSTLPNGPTDRVSYQYDWLRRIRPRMSANRFDRSSSTLILLCRGAFTSSSRRQYPGGSRRLKQPVIRTTTGQGARAWHRSLRSQVNAIFWVPRETRGYSVGEVAMIREPDRS